MKIGSQEKLKKRVALVTGASSGIGKATAERLATAGASPIPAAAQ